MRILPFLPRAGAIPRLARMTYLLLFPLGVAVGAFGTLIGAGGGFILMPILMLAYPGTEPATLTAISLAVVFFNAASGTYSYARMKRVDFKSGLLFLLPGIPGSITGAYTIHLVPRHAFNLAFGLFLLVGGAFIFLRTFFGDEPKPWLRATFRRTLVDAEGTRHVYAYNLALGMTLSFAVGMASSMLGIGGGIIHVPAMVNLLDFPVHIATATSHFILMAMSLTATVMHVIDGALGWEELPRALAIAAGAVVGAQIGARLSKRIHGRWIMRSLAAALALVGIRILILASLRPVSGPERQSNSSLNFSSMSGCSQRVWPIRMARTPTDLSFCTSSRVLIPLSETSSHVVVQQARQPGGRSDVHLHRRQVAVVDPQDAVALLREPDQAADRQQRIHVVDLQQHGHAQLARGDHQVHQVARRQRLGDQQDRVGPGGPRLVHLPQIDDEVLAQHRQRHRLLDLCDVFEPALEVLLVGQDADRRRPRISRRSGRSPPGRNPAGSPRPKATPS